MKRVWKKVLWWSSGAVLLVAVVLVGGGWYLSDQISNGTIKPDRKGRPLDLEVTALAGGTISLRTLPGIKTLDWKTDGTWGLTSNTGYGQVGKIVNLESNLVVREYTPVDGGINVGDKVRVDHFAFNGDPLTARGIAYEQVSYSSDVGAFPAWYVKGSGDVWAIIVHGRVTGGRDATMEALRVLPVFAGLGLPTLVINYRNDVGLPQNPDGKIWFGMTEWRDVEGAVRYALDHGAQRVVLMGYSMGGAAVVKFLYESPLADKVDGVVLDSPLLDFGAAVSLGASQKKLPLIGHVPSFLTAIGKYESSIRFGIDYSQMNYLSGAGELAAPILLIHGEADREDPIAPSEALAKARPDIVTFVRIPGADHTRGWNVATGTYEAEVRDFLKKVVQ